MSPGVHQISDVCCPLGIRHSQLEADPFRGGVGSVRILRSRNAMCERREKLLPSLSLSFSPWEVCVCVSSQTPLLYLTFALFFFPWRGLEHVKERQRLRSAVAPPLTRRTCAGIDLSDPARRPTSAHTSVHPPTMSPKKKMKKRKSNLQVIFASTWHRYATRFPLAVGQTPRYLPPTKSNQIRHVLRHTSSNCFLYRLALLSQLALLYCPILVN